MVKFGRYLKELICMLLNNESITSSSKIGSHANKISSNDLNL